MDTRRRNRTLFIGQPIEGATAGAPLVVTSNLLAQGLYNNEVNSSTGFNATTTLGVLGSATVTPAAGTYLVVYSASLTASSAGGNVLSIWIYVGGTAQADTKRTAMPYSSQIAGVFQNMSIGTNKLVTVTGSQAIAIEGSTSAGTITITGFNFDVVRIA